MSTFTTRPVIRGTHGVLTSGHYLATAAGFRIMQQGGNAFDAAAAMAFCLCILEPERNGLGGEVPILLYSARDRKVFAIGGQGFAPKALTIDFCRKNGIELLPPDGYLSACVPGMVDAWAVVLARWGTMSFAQILQPAIELAERGFPMYEMLRGTLHGLAELFRTRYRTSAALYLPDGDVPALGAILRNPGMAWTLQQIVCAETAAGGTRIARIEAARDAFYKGEIAERIVRFIHEHPVEDKTGRANRGLLALEDLAEWHATVEEPVAIDYQRLRVHKCPPWSQGPVFLQQLALLEGFDLKPMGAGSAGYLHTLVECAKLAFADREAWYGDPLFDDVPLDVLLSKEYAQRRRQLVGTEASRELRPGDAGRGVPDYVTFRVIDDHRRAWAALAEDRDSTSRPSSPTHTHDTTHLDALDAEGNMIAATPSGGWIPTSPVIEGLGFPVGTRAQMFYLNPRRPNALAPHKRPRTTLTPTLVLKQGKPFMAFGTEGGDAQDQWTLQFFVNHVVFGMNLQEAIDAPTVTSLHFPASFHPREGFPARLQAEGRIGAETLESLRARGHDVHVTADWINGKVMAVQLDPTHGTLLAAASPKNNISYAMGW